MGSGSYSSSDWTAYSARHIDGKSTDDVFKSKTLHEDLDPTKFKVGLREALDNDDNPMSTPVAIFSDVTGSMGVVADTVIRKLDVVASELFDRKPVTNVQLMTGAIGDAYYDKAPIQATQFEADIRIKEATQKLYIERGGGGNRGESYALPWLLCGLKTVHDSFTKRGKKGYLFTIGDEPLLGVSPHNPEAAVTVAQAKKFLDLDLQADLSAAECLEIAERQWHVFHIVVERAHSGHRAGVEATFGKIMGDRLLWLQDVDLLPELIVSTIEVNEGRDKATTAASWGKGKDDKIASAMKDLMVRNDADAGKEVVRL